MYILFIPAALALLLALAMNLYPIFMFKKQKPMLEQIEEERWEQRKHEQYADCIANY
jgi:hypothetical protein